MRQKSKNAYILLYEKDHRVPPAASSPSLSPPTLLTVNKDNLRYYQTLYFMDSHLNHFMISLGQEDNLHMVQLSMVYLLTVLFRKKSKENLGKAVALMQR